ncbi:unnamed protein product, partial [Adineta steineri]
LAAGTGLMSKLLIEYIHISPSSLYLVEPAEQMCIRARDKKLSNKNVRNGNY